MHQSVFADIEKTSACRAVPSVRKPLNNVALKAVVVGKSEQTRAEFHNALVNTTLNGTERLKLTGAVVQHANSTCKSKLACPISNLKSVFRLPDIAAQNRIDRNVEPCVFSKPLQLAIEYF